MDANARGDSRLMPFISVHSGLSFASISVYLFLFVSKISAPAPIAMAPA
jgi:hypothetical protein